MRAIALCVLLPLSAIAEAPPATPVAAAQPTAPEAPRWSIGAGVSFTTRTIVGSSLPPVGYQPTVPTAAASLERRLSEKTWLVVGVSGSAYRSRQDLPADVAGVTRDDLNQLALSAGARWVLTPARAPVDVSALALVDAGILGGRLDLQQYAGAGISPVSYDTSGWLLGASFGIAVDRALTESLSLRIATPLVGVEYASTRTKTSGQTLDGSDFTANVLIAPRLELRVAF